LQRSGYLGGTLQTSSFNVKYARAGYFILMFVLGLAAAGSSLAAGPSGDVVAAYDF